MAMQPEVRYINAYVSGTAVPQQSKMPQKTSSVQLPKAQKRQRYILQVDMVAVVGILAALVFSVMLIVSLVQMNQARQEALVMKNYALSLQQTNTQLQNTYHSSYNLDEVRDIALAMGMVPVEQVPHLQMQVTEPQTVPQQTAWESFWTFFLGMFA